MSTEEPAPQNLSSKLRSAQESNPGHINPQSSSPLFSTIPGEIRNRIFEFALSEYDDETKPYRPNNWFYRPGYHYPQKISTSILQTCRRIYFEAHLPPITQNEHVFWGYRGPKLLWNNGAEYPLRAYVNRMTSEQRDAVEVIHYFTQQFVLEGHWGGITHAIGRARKIKITIRHQDWWYWESDDRLGINPFHRGRALWYQMDYADPSSVGPSAWGYQFRNVQGLQELEIEFETLTRKKYQLDAIVQRALGWEFDLADGRVLSAEGTNVVQSSWEGHVELKDRVDLELDDDEGFGLFDYDSEFEVEEGELDDTVNSEDEDSNAESSIPEDAANTKDSTTEGGEAPQQTTTSLPNAIGIVLPTNTNTETEQGRELEDAAPDPQEPEQQSEHSSPIVQRKRTRPEPAKQSYYVLSVTWKAKAKVEPNPTPINF